MKPVLNVLLTHQRSNAVAAMVDWWAGCVPRESIVVAYGGSREDFDALTFAPKLFIDDPRLRTRDHQRERQSYGTVFREVALWMENRSYSHVHLAEYDHLPLAGDLNGWQIRLMEADGADVLGFHLRRVDETNCAHYLCHAADPQFFSFWKKITCRGDARVVLSMTPTGSFWTREAFAAVAAIAEPHPMYVEIFPPTLAHHLGFRIRDYGPQTRFVSNLGDRIAEVAEARKEGAWIIHPVKTAWDGSAPARHLR